MADVIWTDCGPSPAELSGMQNVLDRGSLFHKMSWPRGSTYNPVCDMYVNNVYRNYVKPIIVFDGYLAGHSTKYMAHIRRSGGVIGAEVKFDGDMPIKTKKEHFLANNVNKQNFIYLLGNKLKEGSCTVLHAEGDADVWIVQFEKLATNTSSVQVHTLPQLQQLLNITVPVCITKYMSGLVNLI